MHCTVVQCSGVLQLQQVLPSNTSLVGGGRRLDTGHVLHSCTGGWTGQGHPDYTIQTPLQQDVNFFSTVEEDGLDTQTILYTLRYNRMDTSTLL